MTIKEAIQQATEVLAQAEISGARTDTELILAHVLQQDRAWLLAHEYDSLTQEQLRLTTSLVQKRAQRQPLSYVLGTREFASLDFKIDARVLTPRVETETVVDQVIKRAPRAARTLDVGTGSGAMAIALKYHRPDIIVTASEISKDALELARENAQRLLGKNYEITFIESDLLESVEDVFDIIVANLPYVTRSMDLLPEVQAEPDVALFGGADDGLDLYRKFFDQLPGHAHDQTQLWIESDPWQQPALITLAQTVDMKPIFQDYFILGLQRATKTNSPD
ncbi:peptide chain release factor N(5)-glutamine methyltransferase [bacterium]|nr:peptide chain release factor N(5)-glutamine methyltransferase [bacterium]